MLTFKFKPLVVEGPRNRRPNSLSLDFVAVYLRYCDNLDNCVVCFSLYENNN